MAKYTDSLRGYAFAVHKRDSFRCRYCGIDGTKSFDTWLTLSWDHLLPKGHPNRDKLEFMGPLHGLKVIEFAGIGPGPFAAMLFADMGAEVVRIERKSAVRRSLSLLSLGPFDVAAGRAQRGARHQEARRARRRAAADRPGRRADRGLSPRRDGAAGLGAGDLPGAQPALVYGRMTGWGQDGPLAHAAGHDITTLRSAARSTPSARRSSRCRRSTWWATSAAAP
jgi:hypothetical protein